MSNGKAKGKPDHSGPPEHVERRKTERDSDGNIKVTGDKLKELETQIDWDNLTAFEQWVVLKINE